VTNVTSFERETEESASVYLSRLAELGRITMNYEAIVQVRSYNEKTRGGTFHVGRNSHFVSLSDFMTLEVYD